MDLGKIENGKSKMESEYKKDDLWTLQLNMKYVN